MKPAHSPEQPEVILKLGFMIDATGAKDFPVLEIGMLANAGEPFA